MDFPTEIDKFDFADSIEEAKRRFESSQTNDPLSDIPPTLLNKRDIAKYVSATGMIWPFNPDSLKAASYEVRLGREILYWDKDGNQQHKKELKDNDPIIFKRNSITFVGVEPKFFIPFYIALRFNLSITHVHRGLLLGTGPLIDPTFVGRIMIPIHNLTNNDYIVRPGDDLIAVEFTKIWFDKKDDHNINFEKMTRNVKKPDMSFVDYFQTALPENIKSVESSLEQTVEKAEQYVAKSEEHIKSIKEESIAKIKEIKESADRTKLLFTGVGLVSAVALFIAIMAVFFQVKSVVSDANNYVASSTNALQGNLKLAIDPKGFEKAVNSAKDELSNQNRNDFEVFAKRQEQLYAQIDKRLGFVANRIAQFDGQNKLDQLALRSEIELIRKDLKTIKDQKLEERIQSIYQEFRSKLNSK